jgi:hypothetical protein
MQFYKLLLKQGLSPSGIPAIYLALKIIIT